MTKREAAIVMAYTGVALGDFQTFHEYAEEVLGRPVWTHQFGDQAVADELRAASRADFLALQVHNA